MVQTQRLANSKNYSLDRRISITAIIRREDFVELVATANENEGVVDVEALQNAVEHFTLGEPTLYPGARFVGPNEIPNEIEEDVTPPVFQGVIEEV